VNSQSTSNISSPHSSAHHRGAGGHMWLMLLCCLVPIALFAAVAAFGIPFSGVLSFAVFLLCPLMMVFMMRDHRNGNENGSETATAENRPTTR
jgi:uncharacterized membrane protein